MGSHQSRALFVVKVNTTYRKLRTRNARVRAPHAMHSPMWLRACAMFVLSLHCLESNKQHRSWSGGSGSRSRGSSRDSIVEVDTDERGGSSDEKQR